MRQSFFQPLKIRPERSASPFQSEKSYPRDQCGDERRADEKGKEQIAPVSPDIPSYSSFE